jgi:hypothetical protein
MVGLAVLTPKNDNERAGIVTVSVKEAADFNGTLTKLGILAGQYLPGQIRMDVALFHNEEDIERTLATFSKVAASRGTA